MIDHYHMNIHIHSAQEFKKSKSNIQYDQYQISIIRSRQHKIVLFIVQSQIFPINYLR